MKRFASWLDARTGAVAFARRLLFESLPGGAQWRRCWLSAVGFTFCVQVITGFCLLAGYSASTQTAWESVFHLQFQTPGGWLLRGLHVVAAQAFVVLLALHLMQLVVRAAYLAPRELNLWLALALLPLAIAQSVTGWLLPFDQKGYWAARVPLNILAVVPGLGPTLQRLLLGGSEVGHQTLTRFLALHATLIPLAIAAVLGLLVHLSRRNLGKATAPPAPAGVSWWPDQALRDAVACLAVLVTLLFFVLKGHFAAHGDALPELLAPADPTEQYAAARPEWFMLFLFQFLKYFRAGSEVWGAVVIPSLVLLVVAAMPWIGRWRLGTRFNTGFMLVLAAGALTLGGLAWKEDRANAAYQAALARARADGQRARELAAAPSGIPETGALALVRADPRTQGPRIFAQHCASCHRFDGHDALDGQVADPPSASDLKGFAGRAWLANLLNPTNVAAPHYFGGTKFKTGKMVKFVQRDVAGFDATKQAQLAKVVLALSAEAGLKAQREADARDTSAIAEGRELIRSPAMRCTDCHQFQKPDEDATAPDLTGYGSRAWLIAFVSDPAHERFYGRRNDRMPRFGVDGTLDAQSLGLVVDWLRGDWYEPGADAPSTKELVTR